MENMVRRSWKGTPSPVLRAISAVYGMVVDVRHAAWTVGFAKPVRAPVPIISVGGLTIGGSGKTPITVALARHLADSGSRVAVLTAGLADETALHATTNPDIPVLSGRDKGQLASLAAQQGATVVLVDSGFQHRRLERDLEIVTISADYRGTQLRLPAGPFRDRWAELWRTDVVIVVRRHAPVEAVAHLTTALSHSFPGVHIANAWIVPTSLSPVSEAAHDIDVPAPDLAVTGVMWPGAVFVAVTRLGLAPEHCLALPDHAVLDQRTVARIVDLAGSGGVVCTGKDVGKLVAALPLSVPVWQIVEHLEWGQGGDALLRAVTHVAGMGTDRRVTAQ